MEGVMEGIPSIAFSLASHTSGKFEVAGRFAQTLVAQIAKESLPEPMLLNVNIPPVDWTDIAGVLVTRQGIRRYFDTFQKRLDPRGIAYYWLAGEAIEEIAQPDDPQLPSHILTDVEGIQQKYITMTPLQYTLNSITGINSLKDRKFTLD
jgi:5'-nucleotidase